MLEQNSELLSNIITLQAETKEYKFKVLMYSQIIVFFMLIRGDKNIIANDLLKTSVSHLYNNTCKNCRYNYSRSNEILSEALPIFLPDFYKMDFEDILELRYLAKDELEEMRNYINSLSNEYLPDDKNMVNLKLFINNKITPSIRQLENKVYNLRIGTLQKALQSLKNPFTYTPLLTSFFANIPAHLSLAMSVGLIAAETGLEYLKEKKEVELNPLYFSVKLKKTINKLL